MASIFQSRGYKSFMAKLYGWGACFVLIGALFKLQHWQGAGFFLIAGLSVEALIFFFSAFEPLPGDWKWERVFPELGDNEKNALGMSMGTTPVRMSSSQGGGIGSLDFGLDASDMENVKNHVRQFNQSMAHLGALATIADASNSFAEGLRNSAQNVHTLNESLRVFSNAYQVTAKSFAESGDLSNQNMSALNRNLNAVNASYELYIQGHQKYAKQNEVLVTAMQQYVNQNNELVDTIKASGERTKQFSAQMDVLNQNIHNLNNIYGSMLTTVSSALKR